MKITEKEAVPYSRPGVKGTYYQLPKVYNGTTFAYAELSGEHGERTIGERARIYYLLEGSGKFIINGKEEFAEAGDLVVIPPHSTYNYWPKDKVIKVILVMELINFDTLKKK